MPVNPYDPTSPEAYAADPRSEAVRRARALGMDPANNPLVTDEAFAASLGQFPSDPLTYLDWRQAREADVFGGGLESAGLSSGAYADKLRLDFVTEQLYQRARTRGGGGGGGGLGRERPQAPYGPEAPPEPAPKPPPPPVLTGSKRPPGGAAEPIPPEIRAIQAALQAAEKERRGQEAAARGARSVWPASGIVSNVPGLAHPPADRSAYPSFAGFLARPTPEETFVSALAGGGTSVLAGQKGDLSLQPREAVGRATVQAWAQTRQLEAVKERLGQNPPGPGQAGISQGPGEAESVERLLDDARVRLKRGLSELKNRVTFATKMHFRSAPGRAAMDTYEESNAETLAKMMGVRDVEGTTGASWIRSHFTPDQIQRYITEPRFAKADMMAAAASPPAPSGTGSVAEVAGTAGGEGAFGWVSGKGYTKPLNPAWPRGYGNP